MPVFTYKCDDCEKVFDALLFAGETDDVVSCPACGCKNVSRQLAIFARGRSGGSCAPGAGFT